MSCGIVHKVFTLDVPVTDHIQKINFLYLILILIFDSDSQVWCFQFVFFKTSKPRFPACSSFVCCTHFES